MAPTRLSFGLLGPLQILVDGTALPLGGPKQRVVLATLLMNRNRAVAVESLITAAWEDDPPSDGRTNIHVYVSNLRKLLAAGDVDARKVLEKRSPGYQLNVVDGDVDAGRFMTASSAGVAAAAARRFEEASSHLTAALAEWRGPVLEDLRQYQFIDAFAVALTEQKMSTHAARAEAEIACGRAALMVGELEALVAEHPFREPVWAQLMTAYYLAGRQSDALEAYRRLTGILADELGIDPNADLRALHGRILRQEHLDVAQLAQLTAERTISTSAQRMTAGVGSRMEAWLRSSSGQWHPVKGMATTIGRLPDNDVVLNDGKVSRRHAVIVNTGISFVIYDAGSANGVELHGRLIANSAPLNDGDHLRIGTTDFVFEMRAASGDKTTETRIPM